MEGKSVLFKKFADIDSIDLEIDSIDVDKFINCVQVLEPSFGGINSKLSMVTLLSFSSTIISQNLKGMKEGEGSCLLMPLSANRKTSTLFCGRYFL